MTKKPTILQSNPPTIPKIAFFGTPRLADIVLSQLITSDFKPALVVTQADKKTGRGQILGSSPVKQTALQNNLKVIENLGDLPEFDLGILVAYGKILPEKTLAIPKYGIINIHPSLLPKYRGPAPIQTAILNGDAETGATIMKLDQAIDHGPTLAQKTLAIEKTDTHATLIEKLGVLGSTLLLETLPGYIEDKTNLTEQNHAEATFTKHITKQNGLIDLLAPPDPATLDRMIRAYYPWPTVWAEIELRSKNSELRKMKIKFLPDQMLQPEGKKPMSIKEFKNGYPEAFAQLSLVLTEK